MLNIDAMKCIDVRIPFTTSFSHASTTRIITETVIIELSDQSGVTGYGEGCPRDYVSGESVESVVAFCNAHRQSMRSIHSLEDVRAYQTKHRKAIDKNPAAWCALELAILDLLGKLADEPVEVLLNVVSRQEQYKYTAVLGDSDAATFEHMYQLFRSQQFSVFKIKLNGNLFRDREKLDCMRNDLDVITLRADANNLWRTVKEARVYLQKLDLPFIGIEEPIQSKNISELSSLAKEIGIKVILDESLLRFDQIDELAQCSNYWTVNARVSKFGGLLRSIEIIEELIRLDIDITVGCQVGESSLLTRAALILADVAGQNLKSQEGAFGKYLLTQDPFTPSLQFGEKGLLLHKALACREAPGLGLIRDKSVALAGALERGIS